MKKRVEVMKTLGALEEIWDEYQVYNKEGVHAETDGNEE